MIAKLNTAIMSLAALTLLLLWSMDARALTIRNRPVATEVASSVPDCTTPVPSCCKPIIIYRHVGCHNVCCGCQAPIETILEVKDPCSCATASIPVCLPACCTDAQLCVVIQVS